MTKQRFMHNNDASCIEILIIVAKQVVRMLKLLKLTRAGAFHNGPSITPQ